MIVEGQPSRWLSVFEAVVDTVFVQPVGFGKPAWGQAGTNDFDLSGHGGVE